MYIKTFTFNPFQENTYVLSSAAGKAIIVDPGMYFPHEFDEFFGYLEMNRLEPTLLLNTHTHLDHLFGNAAILNRYPVPFAFHEADCPVFEAATSAGALYGLTFEKSPDPSFYLKEGEQVLLDGESMGIRFAPGHSPGSVCLYNAHDGWVLAGDVLFRGSIGRSDLPGGDYETLIDSICRELLTLPDETVVHSGHGPATTIGEERHSNPFLLEVLQSR